MAAEYTPEQLQQWWDAYYRQQASLASTSVSQYTYTPETSQSAYTQPTNTTTTAGAGTGAAGSYISRPEEYMQQQSVYSQSAYEASTKKRERGGESTYQTQIPQQQSAGGVQASSKNGGGGGFKKVLRVAGGEVWEDKQLAGWDANDFRIFVGDLGGECDDEKLAAAFSIYPSFQRATVIRDKRTGKSKGYGFVSYKNPNDFAKALRELNGKYIANRPIKLRKSSWKSRNIEAKDLKKKVKSGEVLLFPR